MNEGNKNLNFEQNIHTLGVNYLSNFLDRVGITVLEVNTDPDHHFQLLVRINNRSLLIAVRTACHPDAGTIDTSTLDTLIRESEKLNVIPHFAGLSVIPGVTDHNKGDDPLEAPNYKVIFNGICAIHKSELLAANDSNYYQCS